MSLCSTNYISSNIKIKKLYWVIERLGYKEIELERELRNSYRKCYLWRPSNLDLTYVGVELNISKNDNGKIRVETRTRAGRSYVELTQQNTTIKTIKDFFGGTFETDYGKNIYMNSEDCSPEKSNIAMALYVQRWKFNNALIPIKIFAQFMEKSLHKDTLAGDLYGTQVGVLPFTDHLRPCVVSANIQLPYIIGAWENYVKNSYLSILKYVNTDNKIIKPDRLSVDDLEKIKTGESSVEECIVSKFSFQRPQTIINNFGQLDKKLDVNAVFDKPYKRKTTKLKTSIDEIITLRNQIVHDGFIDTKLTDKDVKNFLDEVEEAANRLYKLFAKKYEFKANFNF